jgi:hypothetical protein
MFRFTKPDCPVWLLLETGHDIGSDIGLLTLDSAFEKPSDQFLGLIVMSH